MPERKDARTSEKL